MRKPIPCTVLSPKYSTGVCVVVKKVCCTRLIFLCSLYLIESGSMGTRLLLDPACRSRNSLNEHNEYDTQPTQNHRKKKNILIHNYYK